MRINPSKSAILALAAALAMPATAASAQVTPTDAAAEGTINVYGQVPSDLEGMAAGPEFEGFISAREGNAMQVTTADGQSTTIRISDGTDIKARGGFLGLGRTRLGADALFNGLPVSVETVQWGSSLIASQVRFSDDNYETAAMIQRGTAQQFAEQTAATDALRNRVADIDQYNIRGTTNVYFDTGRWDISARDRAELCRIAQQAEQTDNALLLVVGYTDDVGDYDYNQELSERRAARVTNFLQQECDWQPWRMLTPTGMAEADPTADNSTEAGRAQNRRVAVNILVSKAVDGLGG